MQLELEHSLRSDWQRQSNELKDILVNYDNLVWIDKEDFFIGKTNGFIYENKLTIYDTGHLTAPGFYYFGKWITNRLDINHVK